MRCPRPVRDGENVVLRPFEALVADRGAAITGDNEANGIPRRARQAGALVDPLEIEIEGRHDRPSLPGVAEGAGAVFAALGAGKLAARLVGRKTIVRRALGADFPEALVLPGTRLEETRIKGADGRHVRRVEPYGAPRALVDVAMPAHRRREDEVALLHLAATAVDDGDGA